MATPIASKSPSSSPLPLLPTASHKRTIKCFSSSLNPQPPTNPNLSSDAAQKLSPLDPNTDPNPIIRRVSLGGGLDRALSLLDSLHPSRVDEDTYISLLKLCEWTRAVPQGSRVYSHIGSADAHLSVRLGNALLSMFVRFGNLYDAWLVFGKMVERDVFSWNVLVGAYGKQGFFDEALTLYSRMIWAGFRPDVYTFPCVLRTCGAVPDLSGGREVHSHVIRFGFEAEVDVLNALVTMYAKCGDCVRARRVFDGMAIRDRVSWNAMISGYFENGECVEGLGLFLRMWGHSVEPDVMTMTSVVSACGPLEDGGLGKAIHGYSIKRDFVGEVSVCNSLVQMYTNFGNMEAAQKVFLTMESKDVVSWTSMISGYEKNGSPSRALEIFDQMKEENVTPDEITLASVLSACACLGRLDTGIELHELARKKGLMPYTIVGNTLLDMYSKSRCIDKALEVFKRMPKKDVISWSSIISGFRINHRSFEALVFFRRMQGYIKPNSITMIAGLSSCAAIGALMCGKEIHAQVLRSGLGFEGFIPNALLDMYAKCGRIEYAQKQFHVHGGKDVVSWNIMLTGYAARGQGNLAIGLFNQMLEDGVHPDEITLVAILCACSRSGMVSQGWDYFRRMEHDYGISPNLRHYACMVDLLGRAGSLDEAHQFIMDMPFDPDAAIWGALLNGCRIHRRVELGELVAKFIFKLDPVGIGYYVLLCNLYADGDMWDKVARVRKLMRQRGLIVDPGCSWVEVKGSVHAFLSGDESHPHLKDIYAVLSGLYARMKAAGFVVPENGFSHDIEASKADVFCGHSERLAVGFGLINSTPGMPIWVTKNLYMCENCHSIIKFMSKIVRRDITVRDTEQYHHFRDGKCSCGDEGYWGRNN